MDTQVLSRRQFVRAALGLTGLGVIAGCSRLPLAGRGSRKSARIGLLSGGRSDTPNGQATLESFRRGLRELGRVEGKDVTLELRYWGDTPDRATALAAELAALPVDVIVAVGSRDAQAAREATTTIPIVMMAITDPVGQQLVASLAHPGGNVTGQSSGTVELTGKRLELLKGLDSGLQRVAVLWEPTNPSHVPQWAAVQTTCPALDLAPIPLAVTTPADIQTAFQGAVSGRAGAVLTMSSAVLTQNRALVASLAQRHQLPSMFMDRAFVEAGGLFSYGANVPELNRTAATFVHKILNGAHPADLPVEQPTKVDFILNQRAEQALGLTVPPAVLQQVTELIQ